MRSQHRHRRNALIRLAMFTALAVLFAVAPAFAQQTDGQSDRQADQQATQAPGEEPDQSANTQQTSQESNQESSAQPDQQSDLDASGQAGGQGSAQQSGGAKIGSPEELVQLLVKGGAYDLALERIDDFQPAAGDLQKWLNWENLRYDLYRRRKEWDRLTERVLNLPLDIPEIRRQELMTHAAEVLLQSGDGDRVRKILRALIWRGDGDSEQLSYWRRLVVRSYLVDHQTHDAEIAMTLYDREYLPADSNWDYIFAQVLLREGNATMAAQRLGSAQDPPERVLRLLARLRADVDPPDLVLKNCAGLRKTLPKDSPLVSATWAVSAEAAQQAGDQVARVEALEQLFDGPPLPPEFTLFDFKVADLWHAYDDLGSRLGNQHNLLFGDPDPWLDLAKSLKGEGSALEARAINAAAALHSHSEPGRGQLHLALYRRLKKAGLKQLAIRLYASGGVFQSVAEVPNAVRHAIVADSIRRRDMKLAARFAEHLSAPGSEQTKLEWDLTRARLALYAGDFSQSESIMRTVILGHQEFDADEADHVMQPIFDLQSVGRGKSAFELLQYMYDRVTTAKQKREILFWLGDAKKSEGEYQTAAQYYLRSAFANSQPYDLWGQSARYSAAEALEEARLFDDAERIYKQLLGEAGETKRAAALYRRLQELWVEKQEPEKPK